MIRALLPYRLAPHLLALFAGLLALIGAPLHAQPSPPVPAQAASPQGAFGPPGGGTGPTHIHATLLAEGPVAPGGTVTLAVLMQPEAGWHGYWSNPGDAGLALTLDWTLPGGSKIGAMRFPVPQTLLISGLMNHVYEHDYVVLVPLTVPATAAPGGKLDISAQANWLACTLQICVPERAELHGTVTVGAGIADPRFNAWRAALPAPLDRPAVFAWTPTSLRIAIPFPRAAKVEAPHLFLATEGLVDYAAPQSFTRKGDLLIAEVPRAKVPPAATPQAVNAVLSLAGGAGGVELSANPGAVPEGGTPVSSQAAPAKGSFWWAVLFAMLGGLILNVMPCVFPILSLKALALARGGDEATARAEGLAYAAGVILACVALGATMLALRAAGEEVGWAFQLQQPGVVLALLLLAVAITANFAGLFELPGLSFERGGGHMGAFGTGLLAAFAATPCTGPFMAAAVGAALLLPWYAALAVFGALGFGLALPFLAIGFVPALRRMLPRPGGWMDTFRKAMAVPMGLTVLALLWLAWRSGGPTFVAIGVVLTLAMLAGFYAMRREQKRGLLGSRYLLMMLPLGLAIYGAAQLAAPPAAEASIIGAKPFSEAALAKARASGKPVFLYFTADWCLSCKVNEQTSIDREATRDAFRKAGVTVLIGDWTRRDAAITRFLTSQGAGGVPLYLWYPKGGGEPQHLPQVLTPDLLAGLAKG
jgi:thiol:disulfide interchange protein